MVGPLHEKGFLVFPYTVKWMARQDPKYFESAALTVFQSQQHCIKLTRIFRENEDDVQVKRKWGRSRWTRESQNTTHGYKEAQNTEHKNVMSEQRVQLGMSTSERK